MLCPKDLKPCCDDLCHGGGCLQMDGEPMWHTCSGCGQPVSDSDDLLCRCDPDDYYDDPNETTAAG